MSHENLGGKIIAQDGKEILTRKFKQHNLKYNSENITFLTNYFGLQSATELYFRIAKGKIDLSKLRDIDESNGILQKKITKTKSKKIVKTVCQIYSLNFT